MSPSELDLRLPCNPDMKMRHNLLLHLFACMKMKAFKSEVTCFRRSLCFSKAARHLGRICPPILLFWHTKRLHLQERVHVMRKLSEAWKTGLQRTLGPKDLVPSKLRAKTLPNEAGKHKCSTAYVVAAAPPPLAKKSIGTPNPTQKNTYDNTPANPCLFTAHSAQHTPTQLHTQHNICFETFSGRPYAEASPSHDARSAMAAFIFASARVGSEISHHPFHAKAPIPLQGALPPHCPEHGKGGLLTSKAPNGLLRDGPSGGAVRRGILALAEDKEAQAAVLRVQPQELLHLRAVTCCCLPAGPVACPPRAPH